MYHTQADKSRDGLDDWVGVGEEEKWVQKDRVQSSHHYRPLNYLYHIPDTRELKSSEALNCHHCLCHLYVSSSGNGFCLSVGEFHVQSFGET